MNLPSTAIKTLKALAYLLFLLLAVLVLLEVAARFVPGWNQWVNLVGNPDHRIPPRSGPDINSDGIRSRREASDFTPDGYNVIFLGDSFTFGLWLGDKQNIPQQFEKIALAAQPGRDIKVANFGWVSSSPLLSLRLLKDIGKKYHPDLVVQIIDMTDVGDDLYYHALINKTGIYRWGQYAPTTTLFLQKSIREHTNWDDLSQRWFGLPKKHYFIVQQPMEKSRYAFDFMRQHIDATYTYARDELGARYMLVIIPRYFQYNIKESPKDWEKLAGEYQVPEPYAMEPFRYFDEMKSSAPYPVYSLLPDFKAATAPTVFEGDAHLNASGARLAAEAIYRYCQQSACRQEQP